MRHSTPFCRYTPSSWPDLGLSWLILACLGSISDSSWHIQACKQRSQENPVKMQVKWPSLALSSSHLGPSSPSLGRIWAHLGPSWPHLGCILARLDPILAHHGPILAHLGPILTYLGPILAPSCHILGPSLSHLGPILAYLVPPLSFFWLGWLRGWPAKACPDGTRLHRHRAEFTYRCGRSQRLCRENYNLPLNNAV